MAELEGAAVALDPDAVDTPLAPTTAPGAADDVALADTLDAVALADALDDGALETLTPDDPITAPGAADDATVDEAVMLLELALTGADVAMGCDGATAEPPTTAGVTPAPEEVGLAFEVILTDWLPEADADTADATEAALDDEMLARIAEATLQTAV